MYQASSITPESPRGQGIARWEIGSSGGEAVRRASGIVSYATRSLWAALRCSLVGVAMGRAGTRTSRGNWRSGAVWEIASAQAYDNWCEEAQSGRKVGGTGGRQWDFDDDPSPPPPATSRLFWLSGCRYVVRCVNGEAGSMSSRMARPNRGLDALALCSARARTYYQRLSNTVPLAEKKSIRVQQHVGSSTPTEASNCFAKPAIAARHAAIGQVRRSVWYLLPSVVRRGHTDSSSSAHFGAWKEQGEQYLSRHQGPRRQSAAKPWLSRG
ncbi:hypothetical protein CC78DRAFT_563477 [Lojkania enalia]|uniref:Uncharacterized protein n=1 Tax=Lojkania enalia TaxID=147567 RepID=A0A9P4NCZ0_9PLEO|nr:hypothetical protein CC78DRAFT_563477 [Didymosphaeria enalia]